MHNTEGTQELFLVELPVQKHTNKLYIDVQLYKVSRQKLSEIIHRGTSFHIYS